MGVGAMRQACLSLSFAVLRRLARPLFGWSAGRERARDVIRRGRKAMWERSGAGGIWTPDPRRRW